MKRSSMRFLLLHHRYPHTGWQAFLLRWLLIATHLAVLWISAEDDDSNRPGTFPYLRDDHHASGASAPSFSFPKAHTILNASQIQDFRRDGFLFVRGLWDQNHKSNTDSFQPPPPPLLDPIIRASEQLVRDAVTANTTTPQTYFGIHQKGVMIRHTEFRNLAVYSSIPQVVAELMGLDAKTQNVRILRDIFLAKGIHDDKTCDWHVDDQGFWPESFQSEATELYGIDQSGINVWIALDDMPYDGSMAVSPGSHRADWRYEAYQALGQDHAQDGGKSKQEIQDQIHHKNNTYYETCDMHLVRPDLYMRIEKTKVQFDIRRGDILFATRFLFHRTLPVSAKGRKFYKTVGQDFLKRYSIRYVPGTARLPNGWSVEWSVMDDATHTGKSLNDITDNSPWQFYPQVWPIPEPNLDHKHQQLAQIMEKLADKAMDEMKSAFF